MTPILIAALLLAFPVQGHSKRIAPPTPPVLQQGARSVPVGDPLRRQLLDSLRPTIQRDLGGRPVQFMVDKLKVQGDWAFYAGSVQQPNGQPIDFSRTHYASALENGVFDGPLTFALLRRAGTTWTVVTFVIGPTDVAYLDWPDSHGAPEALFR